MAGPDRTLHGRYRVLSPLGGGGMGTVWRGDDLVLRRPVALKAVNVEPGHPGDAGAVIERAMREAQALARVEDPAVVEIYDVFVESGVPWLVMELIDGRTLADLIARGPVAEREVARIGLRALAGLDAAHRAGILHRDVKPANILLAADGRVLLADFGIARVSGAASLTATNTVLGTVEFLAPEQIADRQATVASDLWALGVTLFYALEGYSPFRRGSERLNIPATLYAIMNAPAPRPGRAHRLGHAVAGLLDKDPATRMGAGRLRVALEDVLGKGPRSGRPRPVEAPAPGPRRPARAPDVRTKVRARHAETSERAAGRTEIPGGDRPVHAAALVEDMTVEEAARAVVRAGAAAAAPALLALHRHRAALILAALPASALGGVLDAMAASPEATALILPMLTAERAGRAIGRMTGSRALAVLTAMPPGEAALIVARADRRTTAWVLGAMARPDAARVLAALPLPHAAQALGYVPPAAIAELLRALPDDHADTVLRGLAHPVRTRVSRLL